MDVVRKIRSPLRPLKPAVVVLEGYVVELVGRKILGKMNDRSTLGNLEPILY